MFDFGFPWRRVRIPIYLLICVFVVGTIGYRILYPDIGWVRLFFMTAITLSTVGYGDVLRVEDDPVASWYTMLLILVGMGAVLYSVSAVTAFIVEGNLGEALTMHARKKKAGRMSDHYIVCGAGQTGIHVVREMYAMRRKIVVLDLEPSLLEEIAREMPKIVVIAGDATLDGMLESAGIERARGLVAVLRNDKDNLFLTVTARMLNADLEIVSRAIDLSMLKKLSRAGANYVVSPNFIGGMRIASEILRPNVVSFLDKMLRASDGSLRVEEARVPPGSSLAGATLRDADISGALGLTIIAYSPDGRDEDYVYNPGPELVLNEGGVLLFIGEPRQQMKLEKYLAS